MQFTDEQAEGVKNWVVKKLEDMWVPNYHLDDDSSADNMVAPSL
jgi:hypothetical protein